MQLHPWVWAALSIVPFLFNAGLQVSGYNNFTVSLICWSLVVLILILAGIDYIRKRHRVRWENGLVSLESWYFIAPCLLAAILGIAGAAYGLGLRTSSNSSPLLERGESASPAVTNRLIKDPRIEWDAAKMRLSLHGRFQRAGGQLSVYISYMLTGGAPVTSAREATIRVLTLGALVEPRIKIDPIDHFDRGEKVNIQIGFVTLYPENNSQVIRWGDEKSENIQVGITYGSYFGNVILVWRDGSHPDELYPFAVIARSAASNMPTPPLILGPDILMAISEIGAHEK